MQGRSSSLTKDFSNLWIHRVQVLLNISFGEKLLVRYGKQDDFLGVVEAYKS